MIQGVESPDDERLDLYRYVGDPTWLREHDLFVAEGRLVVKRLLALGWYEVESILVNRAAHDALESALDASGTNVYVCDDRILLAVTGFNFHRGCLALVSRPAPLAPETLTAGSLVLGLEGVANPDNVGGLFRTAAAFGASGVLLSPTTADPLYRKAVRTSMGTVLRLPFARAACWPDALGAFKAAGFIVVALTPAAAAQTLAQCAATLPTTSRVLLLVGSEGHGLSGVAMSYADAAVRIPIADDVDSLNVVVAAGIALSRIVDR